jgi:hypothetical protein
LVVGDVAVHVTRRILHADPSFPHRSLQATSSSNATSSSFSSRSSSTK